MFLRRPFAALAAFVVAVAVVAATGAAANRAEEKVSLHWKFDKDKPFYQKMTTVTDQTMKVLNNEVKQKQEQTFYFEWKPEKMEEKDGVVTWTITQKIIGVEMNIDLGGTKVTYNSTKADNQKNALTDFFQNLVGSEFKLTIEIPKDKPISITKIEGRDKFLEKLVNANQQMKPLLEQILSESALKEMAGPTFNALPNKDVAPKDTWDAKSTLNMGPIGKYENKFTYTYDGKNTDAKEDKDKKLDKVSIKTDLTYTKPDAAGTTTSLPFKIKNADLKSKEAKGVALIDAEKGRPVSTSMDLKLEGTLEIEIGGQTTKVELSQTQKTEVVTSDENKMPAPAK
jgi:hypothetical protein